MKQVTLWNGKQRTINEAFMATVDPDKFKALLKQRGLKQVEICNKIGYSAHSIASAIANGVFSGQLVSGLKNYYNITPADYEYKQPEAKPVEIQPQEGKLEVAVEESALYATMKTAMLDAMNEAFAGNMRNLRGMVMAAVREALKPV